MEYERWSSSRSELKNEQILVSVSDTGIGFPPQLAEQIFDPFFTTKPHGTGMGLRISRSIIESHGGHLVGGGFQWARRNFSLDPAHRGSRSKINTACPTFTDLYYGLSPWTQGRHLGWYRHRTCRTALECRVHERLGACSADVPFMPGG